MYRSNANTSQKNKKRLTCAEKSKRSNKNGPRNTIYWVKPQHRHEDGTLLKNTKWRTSTTYNGSWKDNKKHGFGVQMYANGDKYEGMWKDNLRHGSGTLWILTKKNGILRKLYTGDWARDKMEGRGTMYFENGDKYEGLWRENMRFGQGKLVYNDGDMYVGQWNLDQRCGYGCLFKSNGDQFEGMWLRDAREGRGSYYFKETSKMIVGEWVDDYPKCVIYCEADEIDDVRKEIDTLQADLNRPSSSKSSSGKENQLTCFEQIMHKEGSSQLSGAENPIEDKFLVKSTFVGKSENSSMRTECSNLRSVSKQMAKNTKDYRLPRLYLKDPVHILVTQIEKVRRARRLFRILKMPLNMMFSQEQLNWLEKEFARKQNEQGKVAFWEFLEIMRVVDPDLDVQVCFGAIKSLVRRENFRLSDPIPEKMSSEKRVRFWEKFFQFKNSREEGRLIG